MEKNKEKEVKKEKKKPDKKIEKKSDKKEEKKSNKKLLIIFGLCLFIIIIIVIFFNNPKHLKINQHIDVQVGGYNQVVTVKSLDKDITIKEGLYPDKYLRIAMEIENKKNIDSITALHQFSLVGANKELISNCYHDSILPDNNFDKIFPSTIKANSVTKGYLYCPIKEYKDGKLKVTVISGGKISEDNEITYEYQDYYIDLN